MATNGTRLAGKRPALEMRARVLETVADFFRNRDYLAVETPVRIPHPALEDHIDAEPAAEAYLRTSPELHLKRLVAAGYPRVCEIGPCFRRGERGRLHSPEYTMLEWYRADADYRDMLDETEALLECVVRSVNGCPRLTWQGRRVTVTPIAERLSVADAFRRHAGWDPVADYDDARFSVDLVERVEPALRGDCSVALMDYPREAAALARCRAGPPVTAERWELYVGGLELANAFTELTDAAEQRRRFERCASRRAREGREVYPLDEAFLGALAGGMPDCGGVALGIDRLVMLLADAATIEEVRAFPA